MTRLILSFLVSFFILASLAPRQTPAPAAQVDRRIQADLAGDGQARVLILFRQSADLARVSAGRRAAATYTALSGTAQAAQAGVAALLDRQGLDYQSFWIVNGMALQAGPQLIAQLAAHPDVALIVSDAPARVDLPQAALSQLGEGSRQPALAGLQWNVTAVGAPLMWQEGYTGQGLVVAGADTGIAWQHPALRTAYLGWDEAAQAVDHNYAWWDAVREPLEPFGGSSSCGYASREPCDDFSSTHGTHTLGTVVGAGGIGVAPGARWMGCRNMDEGFGAPSTYLGCLQFFLAPTDLDGLNPDPSRHADVINNSYSYTNVEGYTPEQALVFHEAGLALRAAGIFMAVSAGNTGPSCQTIQTPPAIEETVFTVGAVNDLGQIAQFSARGPAAQDGSPRRKPDLSAPGVGVLSSIQRSDGTYGYAPLSGTSMAAPHVAGAVALLWSAWPDLRGDVEATESALELAASPRFSTEGCGGDLPDSRPNHTYGWGVLDLAAIQLPLRLYLPAVGN